MKIKYLLVFFFGPTIFLDVWIQVVVPALSALLADSAFEIMSNLAPVLGAIHLHLLN
jgi:hypothetical protein